MRKLYFENRTRTIISFFVWEGIKEERIEKSDGEHKKMSRLFQKFIEFQAPTDVPVSKHYFFFAIFTLSLSDL